MLRRLRDRSALGLGLGLERARGLGDRCGIDDGFRCRIGVGLGHARSGDRCTIDDGFRFQRARGIRFADRGRFGGELGIGGGFGIGNRIRVGLGRASCGDCIVIPLILLLAVVGLMGSRPPP